MSKDPAFLFYDGDAARDVSHMNRLERGCYFDVIQAQRKFHGITTELLRKILGNDFDQCWPAIEIVLSIDENNEYYIPWLREAVNKRAKSSEKQRKRIQDYWDKKKSEPESKIDTVEIPRNNHGSSVDIPKIENENENIIDNKIGVKGEEKKEESFPVEVVALYDSVIEFFDSSTLPKSQEQKSSWLETLDKCIRIDKYTPQQIFNIIQSIRQDDFWRMNFLSILKLRKTDKQGVKYIDVFNAQLNSRNNATGRNNGNTRTINQDKSKNCNADWHRPNPVHAL
jgi:hypothetical protein